MAKTPPKGSRQSGAERRAALALAALKVLQNEGYAALTARKVAAEAGLSLGHITYNFRDMDELLAEAYRMASETLRQATVSELDRSAPDPLQRLKAFLEAGFTAPFLRPKHLRMRIDLWSAALAHREIARTELALYQRYRDELEKLLYALAGDEPRRRGRVPAVSDTLMATLDGLWLDWMRRRQASAVRNGLDTCLLLAQKLLGEG